MEASEVAESDEVNEVNEAAEVSKGSKTTTEDFGVIQVLEFSFFKIFETYFLRGRIMIYHVEF